MSFSDYLSAHGYSVPPDWIFIQLGTNALFGIYSDREAEAASAASVSQLERMIAMSRSAGAVPKIGIMLVPPPSRDQDAAGANYGSGTNRAVSNAIPLSASGSIWRHSATESLRASILFRRTSLLIQ